MGRAQELLLILDEYWKQNSHLHRVPIYYASKLASKSLKVYQTFVAMMNQRVRKQSDALMNPFRFNHITSMNQIGGSGGGYSDFIGPCVVMASPGFLQSGVSRELFELWCDSEKHGVVIPGYTISGTLADKLKDQPTEITCLDNRVKPRRCSITFFTFAAHVDCKQNMSFVKAVKPDYIILVHGEKTQMERFAQRLENDMKAGNWPTKHRPHVAMPDNGARVKVPFRKNLMASVEGTLAGELQESIKKGGSGVTNVQAGSKSTSISVPLQSNAVLVTEHFTSKLIHLEELSKYSSCAFGAIEEKLMIPLPTDILRLFLPAKSEENRDDPVSAPGVTGIAVSQLAQEILAVVCEHLVQVYDDVKLILGHGNDRIVIQQGLVSIEFTNASNATMLYFNQPDVGGGLGIAVVWNASPTADTLADSVAGLCLQFFSASMLVKMTMAETRFFSQQRLLSSGGVSGTTTTTTTAEGGSTTNTAGRKKLLRMDRKARYLAEQAAKAAAAAAANDENAMEVEGEEGGGSDGNTKKSRGSNVNSNEIDFNSIDPSKKIPLQFLSSTTAANLAVLRDKILLNSKLSRYFEDVKLNSDGSKLIFRGKVDTIYSIRTTASNVIGNTDDIPITTTTGIEGVGSNTSNSISLEDIGMSHVKGSHLNHNYEAFVFIGFSEESEGLHQAVVQSDNEQFQVTVSTVLRSMQ